MLFHELYGSYFKVASVVLNEACSGALSEQRLREIVRQNAFGESVLTIPTAMKDDWHLLTRDLKTPLAHSPAMPLTLLEKRWLKALLADPRIQLFGVSDTGLEDVLPLYKPDTFRYFDRYQDGDPFTDETYIANFKTVLAAIKHRQVIEVEFSDRHSRPLSRVCVPSRLEYSAKDDKFRLLATAGRSTWTFNLARIRSVDVLGAFKGEAMPPSVVQRSVTLELTDQRNALERALLHFSHLEKETVRLDDTHYRLTLHYDRADETELLIRVLSFGPMLRVVAPDGFIASIKERLQKQKECGLI